MRKLLLLILLASLLTACHSDVVTGTVMHKMASTTPAYNRPVYSVDILVEGEKFEQAISIIVSAKVYSLIEEGRTYEFECSDSCNTYGVVRLINSADDDGG